MQSINLIDNLDKETIGCTKILMFVPSDYITPLHYDPGSTNFKIVYTNEWTARSILEKACQTFRRSDRLLQDHLPDIAIFYCDRTKKYKCNWCEDHNPRNNRSTYGKRSDAIKHLIDKLN